MNNKALHPLILLVLISTVLSSCQYFGLATEEPKDEKPDISEVKREDYNPSDYPFEDQVEYYLTDSTFIAETGRVHPYVRVDSLVKNDTSKAIEVYFNKYLSFIPLRNASVDKLYDRFNANIDLAYHDYDISLFTLDKEISELIPNFYRNSDDQANDRLSARQMSRPKAIVRNIDRPYEPTSGLTNHPIALWHSHGWYYNSEFDRWMWQRARLFGTVEDLYPLSIAVPYLIPMFERAGANVFTPRERDFQTHEVVVDNNGSDGNSKYSELGNWESTDSTGFAIGNRPYENGVNPFTLGSAVQTTTSKDNKAQITYVPEIPEKGKYAVYISYQSLPNSTEDAKYTVRHTGGETSFLVNQRIGGQTWIYLGTFLFEEGQNDDQAAVILSNENAIESEVVTADAVRFGGGMGVISRGGRASERPKFSEGARYWMQYAGMPQDEVYHLNEEDDYTDDYQGRGEWVNYLKGAPHGPNENRDMKGLGIPIDASIAFHTDAGVTTNDTTVGTLMIYSVEGDHDEIAFPDSVSRFANRDYADIVQTQIVDDIRAKYDEAWTRRNLYNAEYSEAFRPNVPAILIEPLSHQNFLDMKFGLDPEFKFDLARAIYVGTLKFIATQYGKPYVVQPLPVTHMNVVLNSQGAFELSWRPQIDSLEATAAPDRFVVYTREGEKGFNNGTLVKEPQFILEDPEPNTLYSFKVEAVNDGGASMPSEILAAGTPGKGKSPVMVVNGFDRVSAPEWISEGDFEGFAHFQDRGVPEYQDVSFVGDQYNFQKGMKWINDDEPGHGASRSTYETSVVTGNTRDFVLSHAKAILAAGYPVVSSSDEAVMNNYVDITAFKYVDLLLGEEKATPWQRAKLDTLRGKRFEAFPFTLKSKIKQYLNAGGNLLVSGAYVGTDLYRNPAPNEMNEEFAERWLQFKYRSNYASQSGKIEITRDGREYALPESFTFNTQLNDTMYQVEAPDAIIPADREKGKVLYRYHENKFSAATLFEGYYKTVVLGFPFETIESEETKAALMKQVLDFFDQTLRGK